MIFSIKIKQDFPQSSRINRTGIERNEYMLTLSNRLQKFMNHNYNFNEVNFRVLDANVNDLIKNTRCVNFNNQAYHSSRSH